MADIKQAIEYAKTNPNSPFAAELRKRIESGQMDKELSAAGLKTKGTGYGASELKDDVKQTVTGVKDVITKTKEKIGAAFDASDKDLQGGTGRSAEAVFQAAGTAAGGISEAGGEIIKGGIKAVLPQGIEDKAREGVEKVVEPIVNSDTVRGIIEKYDALDDDTKRNIDAAIGFGSLATDFAGAGLAKKAASPVATAVKEAAETGAEAVTQTAKTIVKPVINAAEKVADVAAVPIQAIKEIPENVAVNLAEKTAQRQAIKALDTPVARRAADRGIEVRDVNTVNEFRKATEGEKKIARNLVETTKKFATGESKTDPIEIIGKPIVDRLKTLDEARKTAGIKLGNAAKELKPVTTEQVAPKVMQQLRSVPGLRDLKVDATGKLDFTDTTLSTIENKSARKNIQNMFRQALKPDSGVSKHRLRQELFETLGGKKRARLNLTDTEDGAYEAIRKGLSDALEDQNTNYKKLSKQYRDIIVPLIEMRKLMKAIPGADEDILDMSAGLLARRLTSTAASNPQIRKIIQDLDKAVGKSIGLTYSVERLQDLYNVLDRYYDIAPRTGFQGQIKNALGDSKTLFEYVAGQGKKILGETAEVRQKVLDELFADVLKTLE